MRPTDATQGKHGKDDPRVVFFCETPRSGVRQSGPWRMPGHQHKAPPARVLQVPETAQSTRPPE